MRLKIFTTFLFTIITLYTFAHRENSYYLEGSVNNQEITIRIDEFGDVCFARFFTQNNLYDRIMDGQIAPDNVFNMYTYSWDSIENKKTKLEKISLKEVELNIWEGTWTDINNQMVDIHLESIKLDTLNHPYARTIKQYNINPYSAKRLLKAELIPGKHIKLPNGIKARNYSNPESGISLFRLDKEQKTLFETDSINMFIEYQMLSAISSKYSCVHNRGYGTFKTDYQIHYANSKLISFTIITTSSCYGGREQTSRQSLTLAMNNAQKVILEDLFWFSDEKHESLTEGEYKWYQYRYKHFGDTVLAILQQEYPKKFNNDNNCDLNKIKTWQFSEWRLTNKGLQLIPSTNKKSQCKIDWAIIPYKRLKKYGLEGYELCLE